MLIAIVERRFQGEKHTMEDDGSVKNEGNAPKHEVQIDKRSTVGDG